MKTMTLTQARNDLLRLANDLESDPRGVVEVSRRGKRIMTLLSSELYDSIVETLEVLSDESMTARLRQALREVERGQAIPWKTARRRLRLEE